jgi:predicted porin
VHAFINEEGKQDGTTRKLKGQNFGASYNFGQITAGVNYKETEFALVKGIEVNGGKTEQMEIGLAYAVTPNTTIGVNYTKAENDGTAHVDAKSKSIAVGYNLGAIALTAQAAKLENYDFTSGTDADVLYLRASTKF